MLNKGTVVYALLLSILTSSAAEAADWPQQALASSVGQERRILGVELGDVELGTTGEVSSPPSAEHRRSSAWSWKRVAGLTTAALLVTGITVVLAKDKIFDTGGSNSILGGNTPFTGGDGRLPPPDETLVPVNSGPILRGLWASIYSDTAWQPGRSERYLFVLGDSYKEQLMLDFIQNQRIDSIALYNLRVALDIPGKAEQLARFIVEAKRRGLKEVLFTGSIPEEWDMTATFNKVYPNRVDGLVTELEFWNLPVAQRTEGYAQFKDLLRYMRKVSRDSFGGKAPVLAYFGHLNSVPNLSEAAMAQEVSQLADGVLQHCYSKNVTGDFAGCQRRLQHWLTTPMKRIMPSLSVEGKEFNAAQMVTPETWFLGEYLMRDPSLDQLEEKIRQNFAQQMDTSRISSYYYYEYQYADYYINVK